MLTEGSGDTALAHERMLYRLDLSCGSSRASAAFDNERSLTKDECETILTGALSALVNCQIVAVRFPFFDEDDVPSACRSLGCGGSTSLSGDLHGGSEIGTSFIHTVGSFPERSERPCSCIGSHVYRRREQSVRDAGAIPSSRGWCAWEVDMGSVPP